MQAFICNQCHKTGICLQRQAGYFQAIMRWLRRINIIELEKGERVIDTTGMICKEMSGFFQGTHVRQTTFFTEKENGEKVTHRPYGRRSFIEHHLSCRMFALNGMIIWMSGTIIIQLC